MSGTAGCIGGNTKHGPCCVSIAHEDNMLPQVPQLLNNSSITSLLIPSA